MGWISWLIIILAVGILACFGVGIFRKKQGTDVRDNGELTTGVSFDPEKQDPVIRSSICTGEKVAGFKSKEDGHFTEVMVLRTMKDEERFKEMYHLDSVKTEY